MDRPSMQQDHDAAVQSFVSGDLPRAEEICRRILSIDAGQAPTAHLLGVIAHQAGHLGDAAALMRHAATIDPDVAEYQSNLSVVLVAQGDAEGGIAAARSALARNPELVDAYYNLGNALTAAGRGDEAVEAYRQALARRFDFPQAHNNLGNVLAAAGRFALAADAYRQAIHLQPTDAYARSNLARALEETGQEAEAGEEHRRAVVMAPTRPDLHSALIDQLRHDPTIGADALVTEYARWDERHAATLPVPRPLDADRSEGRPLRIGYVFARAAAIAPWLAPLLATRDRAAFHVVCYASGAPDDATARLQADSDDWVRLGPPDDAAAERIRADRIDVLVDLDGHARGNRLPVFARRAAPVQVSHAAAAGWIGAMDARLTDAIVDPADVPEAGPRPIRLPGSAFGATSAGARARGPADGGPTFGSFADLRAISSATIFLWARVLQRRPHARLLLRCPALRETDTVARIERQFAAHDIPADRLVQRADAGATAARRDAYRELDVVLDPFPYGGASGVAEALEAGVPVVTLVGPRRESRVGASLLAAAGRSDCVASTPQQYVDTALRLAGDDDTFSATPGDSVAATRAVEAAFRQLWRDWCRRGA